MGSWGISNRVSSLRNAIAMFLLLLAGTNERTEKSRIIISIAPTSFVFIPTALDSRMGVTKSIDEAINQRINFATDCFGIVQCLSTSSKDSFRLIEQSNSNQSSKIRAVMFSRHKTLSIFVSMPLFSHCSIVYLYCGDGFNIELKPRRMCIERCNWLPSIR